jgi:hypothetical protein
VCTHAPPVACQGIGVPWPPSPKQVSKTLRALIPVLGNLKAREVSFQTLRDCQAVEVLR